MSDPLSSQRLLDPDTLGDHLDRLYRAAWALCGQREEAEDLVQETYLRVLARPRFLRNDDDLGYLLRVLRNTFISQRRRRTPSLATLDDQQLEQLPDRATGAPDEILEARLVYGAIGALAPDFREAIVYAYTKGVVWAAATANEYSTHHNFPTDVDTAYLHRLKHHAFVLGLDISGTSVGNDFCVRPGPAR